MVKHAQTIYHLLPKNFLGELDHFMGLEPKGLTYWIHWESFHILYQKKLTNSKSRFDTLFEILILQSQLDIWQKEHKIIFTEVFFEVLKRGVFSHIFR